jgi:hypothetical protein
VSGGPAWALWLTGTLLFGGGVAVMAVQPSRRRVFMAVAAAGLVSTVAVYALLPVAPSAPRGLTLTIAAPPAGATVTTPIAVRVCAGAGDVPGPGRLLSISVDGRQVAELTSSMAAIDTAGGEHTLRAELVTTAHRQYAPPVLDDQTFRVSGSGPLTQPPDCPRTPGATP